MRRFSLMIPEMLHGQQPTLRRLLQAALIVALLVALLLASSGPILHAEAPPLPRSAEKWVRSTLAGMSLEEKAAQMVMIRTFGQYQHPDSLEARELAEALGDLGVGGVIVFDSDLESIPSFLNRLQEQSAVPLLVAADFERGMAFRVRRGTAPLPYAMAVGATRSAEAARFLGEVTAREARAVGVHWVFAPVADVNNNPANPIINIRSFGEAPDLVAEMTRAFVEGARGGGLLTTVKHFPGHGDTAIDSHVALPTVEADRARLEAVELVPFRAAVAAGVDAVMLGHVAVPALDPSGAPATLSRALSGELLRDDLGFEGLIVTDAMEMEGIRPAWGGGAAIRAVQAGADVVLLPPSARVAIQSLARGVREGQLSEERLDVSVRRILEAKARLGLHRPRRHTPGPRLRQVARPQDMARAEEVARAGVTVVRNRADVLPLAAEKPLRLLHLVISGNLRFHGIPRDELEIRRVETRTRFLGPEVSEESAEAIVAAAADATHVLVSSFIRVSAGGGAAPLSASHRRLLEGLRAATDKPMIVVSFGSPYLLAALPDIDAYLCTFGAAPSSQRAGIAALFGEFDVGGRLPVTLPGLYPYGHGLDIAKHPMTLAAAAPEDADFRPGGLDEVDRLLDRFLAEGAFPGGVVAIGRGGRLVRLRPFGKLSLEDAAPAVSIDTIYDIASLTKVVATATMAMILVDERQLDLDSPVVDFLPRFIGEGKDKVSVRHLLTHSSGIDWWAPLYKTLRGKAAYLEHIQAMDLVYEPGSQTLYSDLGMMLLGEILERVAGRTLQDFTRERVFEPLGMRDTRFRPGVELLPRIAPTENDSWRGKILHGEVHDENAHALGGVAPHAGLFSTAGDLARFAQMLLNRGVFEHQRIVSRETVAAFTRFSGAADSNRALGWDTKSEEGSTAGSLFSGSSFGHTGFTGTSIWIDPRRQLFVILLTNRVHPSRENALIREVRPALADAVVRALAEP